MNSLKIGDRVKIISREYVDSLPMKGLPLGFVGCMKKYCGKEAVIKKKFDFDGGICYRIDLDDQWFIWDSNMFERDVKNLLRNE